jgi:hypothetical protein
MTHMDMTTQLMDDMDPRLLEFLQTKVNSFIKWDLVRYYHDNPHAADTSENIARYIGRDARTIEDELTGLVKAGVLQRKELSGVRVYSLSTDASVRDLVSRFVRACNDRQFRVKAIYHVIRAMR